jgi:hypothetical protein
MQTLSTDIRCRNFETINGLKSYLQEATQPTNISPSNMTSIISTNLLNKSMGSKYTTKQDLAITTILRIKMKTDQQENTKSKTQGILSR